MTLTTPPAPTAATTPTPAPTPTSTPTPDRTAPPRGGAASAGATAPWAPRPPAELLADQLAAIDAWHRARRAGEQELAADITREGSLDARRGLAALQREAEAVRARSAHALHASGAPVTTGSRPRALLVHRQEWLRGAVARTLEAEGVSVLGSLADGAEGVGWAVTEQPDLVLVEELLPTLTGVEVVRRVRAFSPRAVVAVQVGFQDRVQPMLKAGADLAVSRRVRPAELCRALLDAVRVG